MRAAGNSSGDRFRCIAVWPSGALTLAGFIPRCCDNQPRAGVHAPVVRLGLLSVRYVAWPLVLVNAMTGITRVIAASWSAKKGYVCFSMVHTWARSAPVSGVATAS